MPPILKSWSASPIALLAVSIAWASTAAAEDSLPRISTQAMEQLDGVAIEYGAVRTSDGAMLRTLFSRPADAAARLPVIYFVQWLSCDTVELVEPDGWTEMLTSLIRDSGYAVMRTEKSGVGDSVGPACKDLDYDTEVRHHREALRALLQRADVDPNGVILFGGSMGASQAPLIAAGFPVRGIIVWGGGAHTWFERMLHFDRRALELGGAESSALTDQMRKNSLFHSEYLLRQKTPTQVEADNPELKDVWAGILGTTDTHHYGRPFRFHYQAQAANWTGAWSRVEAPVLVLYGEYDWSESLASHQLIVDVVNRERPGSAELQVVPGSDHHFTRYASSQAAFDGTEGQKIGAEVAAQMIGWIRGVLRRP